MSSIYACTPATDGTNSMNCVAGDQPISDHGDAAWMLTSVALVYLMTPGVGFFYGGMVSSKNVINTIFMSIICMGIVTVQWTLVGYSWAFGQGSKMYGNFDWAALNFAPNFQDALGFYAATYPLMIHAQFQCAFAVITPAIITGSIIGRMKFVPFCLFILMWSSIVYDALACWVWNNNGWLHTLGAIDYAGGTVVHISSATAGLTAALILGKRHDWRHGHTAKAPNVPFVVLGTTFLWIGWAGFNAGSALSASASAGVALVNTNTAAAAAMLTWVVLDLFRGKVSVAGACSGVVVGLVAITPACGFIAPGWSILVGIIGAAVVYASQIAWRRVFHVDDTLDVFTCHGIGGIVGAILTGLFAQAEYGGVNGSFYGNGVQIGYQLAAIVTTLAWSSVCTAIILGFLHVVCGGLRPTEEEEILGLDTTAHGEQWELAVAATEMAQLLAAKDHQINGEKHMMHNGTLTLAFSPSEKGAKPVEVQVQVHDQSKHDDLPSKDHQQGTFIPPFNATSSMSSLYKNEE